MRRVESYAALAPLLSAQLRRGVVTNCFLSPADYQREIDAGLFYEEGDGFLLLLRQRAGYRLLNFYLHPGAKLFLPGQTLPLVTELACREKDQAAMRRAQDALCALGFTEAFFRLRRTRAAIPVQNTAETPAEASFEAVWAFLLAQFDPLTGCIPPDEELRQAVSAGQVLCLMDADGISGLLHYAPGRAQCEIRHLAVRADCRGHGYAGRLLRLLEAKKMLCRVGLKDRMDHFPNQMSGGQQQRVGIARAFVTHPEVVFADEPTGNLDSKTTKEVMHMIRGFAKRFHQTIVLVSHDPEMTEYADRIVTLIDGRIVSNVENQVKAEIDAAPYIE